MQGAEAASARAVTDAASIFDQAITLAAAVQGPVLASATPRWGERAHPVFSHRASPASCLSVSRAPRLARRSR